MGLLPTEKSKIKTDNPKNLIIFGLPKAGKTTVLSKLENNLIVDLENGSDYISGYTVKAQNYVDLFKIAKALKEEEHQFKFVTLDTVTALEDMAIPYACKKMKEANPSFSGNPDDLFNVPYGAGYSAHRNAVKEIIGWFKSVAENIILVGHVKEKSLNEEGTELNVKQLDLGGKLSSILAADSDAICYVYRDLESGNLMANFGDLNSVLTGARVPHLAGKTITLAEKIIKDDNNYDLLTHWDTIYPSLKK